MRPFLLGVLVLMGVSVTVLSIRPGGLRQQLRLAGRRFRLVLALAGIYLVAATVIRIAFPEGWIADYGPAAIAIVLAAAFMVLGQDPAIPPAPKR